MNEGEIELCVIIKFSKFQISFFSLVFFFPYEFIKDCLLFALFNMTIHDKYGKSEESVIIDKNYKNIYRAFRRGKNKQKRGTEVSSAGKLSEREGNFNCVY